MLNYDAAVIGGGMAGSVAALAAAKRGKNVILITKGPGATSLSSGALDICGSPISAPNLPRSRFQSLSDNIIETISRNPLHPYAIAAKSAPGGRDGIIGLLDESVKFITNALHDAGLDLIGQPGKLEPAPTMLGTWKLTSFVQASQQLGLPEGRIAVAGIRGLNAPDAGALAASLQLTLAATQLGSGQTFDGIEVELDDRDTWTMEEVSERLTRPDEFDKYITMLEKAAAGYRTILVPPVLPDGSRQITLPGGAVVREILATPPSVPGRRLARALGRALEAGGVRVVTGVPRDFDMSGNSLASCSLDVDGVMRKIHSRAWVLASGKFISGGLKKDKAFHETVFGLSVFCGDRELGEVYTVKMLDTDVLGDHAAFSVGLKTDSVFRPVNGEGKVVIENLFAAGSILGGYNYHTGACGLGVSALTGYISGMKAVEITDERG